jgi:RNA polymerase sigma-70 factor (ECF subfamily)
MPSNDLKSETALIERIRLGDREAAEQLLLQHASGLFGYLFKMLRNVQDAEDASQEAMIKVLKGLDRYEERGQFKAWVRCIAHREGLLIIRKRHSASRTLAESIEPHEAERLPEPCRGPRETVIGQETLSWLKGKVKQLPEPERRVFLMRVDQGLTFAEIASLMGCPLNTALGRMRNASLKLRRWLGSVEY